MICESEFFFVDWLTFIHFNKKIKVDWQEDGGDKNNEKSPSSDWAPQIKCRKVKLFAEVDKKKFKINFVTRIFLVHKLFREGPKGVGLKFI